MLVEKKRSAHGDGLFALDSFKEGATVARLEAGLSAQALVLDQIKNKGRLLSVLLEIAKAIDDAVPESIILALYLAAVRASPEQHRDAPHAAYIASLPSELATGVWTKKKFHNTPFADTVAAKRRAVVRQFATFAQPWSICDLPTWRWAADMVQSRTIGLPDLDVPIDRREGLDAAGVALIDKLGLIDQPMIVLVPTLDLCNHAGEQANARWEFELDGEEHIYKLVANGDISKGEEITLSYGNDKANSELFFNYGFTVSENPIKQTRIGVDTTGRGGPWNQFFMLKVDVRDDPEDEKYSLDAPDSIGVEAYWRPVTQDWKSIVALYMRGDSAIALTVMRWLQNTHTNKEWHEHVDTSAVAAGLFRLVGALREDLVSGLEAAVWGPDGREYVDVVEMYTEECDCMSHALGHLERMAKVNLAHFENASDNQ